ncbi:MAG TPA: hypothetical protein PLF40_15950 [Kofleriaceae bacterium]|nr:hypothetical protein [Kofleriaceae bacterium]
MGTRFVSLLGSALLLAGAASCKNAASAEQCTQSMNNILDIEFATAGAKADSPELKADIAKQKKAAAEAKMTEYMDACKNKTPRRIVECTIAAKTAEQLAACDETK